MLEIIDHGKIREIRLARPPVNALNPELVSRLTRTLHAAATAPGAIVISGQQGKKGMVVVRNKLRTDAQLCCLLTGLFQGPTGRNGSRIHSLHDPTYNFEPGSPASSVAKILWHAVTPEPHMCTMSCDS